MKVKGLHWNFKELVTLLKDRQANKFDNVIAITGNRGIGKSELGVKIGTLHKPFKFSKQITFSRTDIMRFLNDNMNMYALADEMINVAHNREFFSQEQIEFIKMINMYRDNFNSLGLVIKNFWVLDTQLRDLVTMRLDVIRRGLAVIHIPHYSTYKKDKWDSVINEKIERTWSNKKISKPKYHLLTTFRGYVKFGSLSHKQRDRYERIKKMGRNVVYKEEIAAGRGNKMTLMDVFNSKNKFEDIQKYAKQEGIGVYTVANKLSMLSRYKKESHVDSSDTPPNKKNDKKSILPPIPLNTSME